MIEITVGADGALHIRGLIPGQVVKLSLGGTTWLLHRHGAECHAHVVREQDNGKPVAARESEET